VDEKSFSTWFEPIAPLALNGSQLTIEVPSQYFYEWLEEHFVKELQLALASVIGQDARLEYSIVVDRGDRNHRPLHMTLPNHSKSQNQQDY
jgi:chromosomal replication initiator protein